ncbi:MAG: metallophosphoesterase family protein [Terracoccus sp.]
MFKKQTRAAVILGVLAAIPAVVSGPQAVAASAASASVVSPHLATATERGGESYSFAVIGDIPYGDDQVAAFPRWIDQINAAKPKMTFHVGDIKNGSSRCDNSYYQLVRSDFDRFKAPFIYTPGDNEWTDCHRENNGSYDPLERLSYDRSVFFDRPGRTLGQRPVAVASQAAAGFPENVQLSRAGVQFAAIHVVGSNNGLQPWTGIGLTTPIIPQVREEGERMANSIAVVRSAFAQARSHRDRAVVIMQQADMFDPTFTPTLDDISAFQPLVQALVQESRAYTGQVYLINGDSHVYNSDRPLSTGSRWLTTYAVTGSANNLQRITVDGSSNNIDWLRMTINPRGAKSVLTWNRVPYTTLAAARGE